MAAFLLAILSMVSLGLSVTTIAQAQNLTLPEVARRQGPQQLPVVQLRDVELLPDTLEELVQTSDLIVHGRVQSAESYLSDNQEDIYTDYVLSPIRVISQGRALLAKGPFLPTPIVVKRWGGEIVIEKVRFLQILSHLRFFIPGEEVLLALVSNSHDGKYHIKGAGAFSMKGNEVEPLVDHPRHEQFRGATLDQFAAEVVRLRSSKPLLP
ncbi:MAG TPA: hypothetical protein VJM31_12640 [Vicinamibacterales bacterium]|nr:hypothetical protein [Vicinamibacterales bacterium]